MNIEDQMTPEEAQAMLNDVNQHLAEQALVLSTKELECVEQSHQIQKQWLYLNFGLIAAKLGIGTSWKSDGFYTTNYSQIVALRIGSRGGGSIDVLLRCVTPGSHIGYVSCGASVSINNNLDDLVTWLRDQFDLKEQVSGEIFLEVFNQTAKSLSEFTGEAHVWPTDSEPKGSAESRVAGVTQEQAETRQG